jgi:hypothetical protein
MRAGAAVLIVLMGLVPAASSGQDGLRSASLPERPLTASVPLHRSDPYRARPRTYRPDRNRLPRLPVYGYLGPQLIDPYGTPPIIVVQVPATQPAPAEPPAPPAPATPPAPYVAGTPGRPKTFYVIPGCYAGDRRPDPGSLAPGCNITRLRVVEPS